MERGEILGLVAGAGRFPVVLASAIRARGHRLVAITVEGDGAALTRTADISYQAGFGELGRIIELLSAHGVHRVLVAGRVSRSRLVAEGDREVRARLAGLSDRGDQLLFQQVAVDLFRRAGIEVGSPLEFVRDLLAASGVIAARHPTDEEWGDIRRGYELARAVADLDIGQSVVLKHGIVLAVEAAEGTDEAIRRASGLAEGVVVAKVARPQQDERFDLPVVGLQTIEVMAVSRAAVLAVEAGRTLLIDRVETLALADRSGIAIVGVEQIGSGLRGPGSAG